ncbi:bile acid:sodium symporter family protein [Saliterribacillus persicus]|uniref:Putative Na+-dependent transporter n=1 Tax=Saliterribacillus persicus TaxID=930114 RepID=A0A368Y1E1_9BACI|nr:bile acid:sodium symporter family protein [Saliterribacillus persicus]RCW73118.1 putative Na+-dependent transporter [Saliterribacillus persicus]
MLYKMNKTLQKMMPFIAPSSVIIGVIFAEGLAPLAYLVPWIFAFMTFAGSLSSNFIAIHRVMVHPFPIVIAVFLLHIVMPFWAWGVGVITFPDDPLTVTGVVLAMVIPTGITSFIWVSMVRGNIALTLSIILVDTILSPLIVPGVLSIFIGQAVELEVWPIMKGLLGMIVLPSILGLILHEWTHGKIHEKWSPRLAPFSKISLSLVIMINSAAVAPYLKNFDSKLLRIAVIVFLIAASGYLLAWLVAKLTKRSKEDKIALIFTGGMRNISAGAVIAVQYFPPPVAVPVVIGMLFQQILASIFGKIVGVWK